MNIVISYATNKFKKSQDILKEQSLIKGADSVINYGPSDLDNDFVKKKYSYFKFLSRRGLLVMETICNFENSIKLRIW